jgi:hypothetical protein
MTNSNRKGHVFLAQNSDINYVRQAYALALSIKKHNKIINKTCLITNDPVPTEYLHAFDYITSISGDDLSKDADWKVENRWKILSDTPFKENLVYDVDMILLRSNDHWWEVLEEKDLAFTSNIFDYRDNVIISDYYRKTFTANDLPNIYVGVFYFKKSKLASEYFKWLEIITKNWKEFYSQYLKNKTPKFYSVDVSSALAIKFMNCESLVLNKHIQVPSFVHMKPAIQGWDIIPEKWTSAVPYFLDSAGRLQIANHQQPSEVFHYTEDEFLTDEILFKLAKII